MFSEFKDLLKVLHGKGFLKFFDCFEDEPFKVAFYAWIDVIETF